MPVLSGPTIRGLKPVTPFIEGTQAHGMNAVLTLEMLLLHPILVREAYARIVSDEAKSRHVGLTRRMAQVVLLIRSYEAANGISPSYDELAEAMGYQSKSQVHRLIHSLIDRGYIEHLPGCARSLRLLPPAHSVTEGME